MNEFVEVKASNKSIGQRKAVMGVGINDASYITKQIISGKEFRCPYYRKWTHMIERCYSAKTQARNPSYIGATVAKEWLVFSNFKAWMVEREWKGLELDKDILAPGNKHYSPETCCFVTQALNTLLTDSGAARGLYPQGVYFDKPTEKYKSQCSYNGKQKHLGYHPTPGQASLAYRKYKHALVTKIALEQTDERIERGLMLHADLILRGVDA